MITFNKNTPQLTLENQPELTLHNPILLKQSPILSRLIAGGIMGVTTFLIVWACFAKIEKVTQAQGKLEPQAAVQEIQVPIDGIVKDVYVENGKLVKPGDILLSFDTTLAQSKLTSLEKIRTSLTQENQFYRALIEQSVSPGIIEESIMQLQLPPEIVTLARNKLEMLTENQLFTAQLGNNSLAYQLNPQQIARLQAFRSELNSRLTAARLDIDKLQEKFRQNQVQIADAESKLNTDKNALLEIQKRNKLTLAKLDNILSIEQKVMEDLSPLVKDGALPRMQLERQYQRVNERHVELVEKTATGKMEHDAQQQKISSRVAEIKNLQQEQKRLKLELNQAQAMLKNASAISEKDIYQQIANNQKNIAAIDTQLGKYIVENEKNLADIDGKIRDTQQALKYHELKANVSGTVFELKAHSGSVANGGKTVMQIVPNDALVAEVYITNKDRGFVQEGMDVDVRIDSFSYSEFGDIKGKLIKIGADALPPDPIHPYYRFPAKIQLEKQFITVNGQEIPLQSGMSLSANIKERDRSVMSIMTGMLTKKLESLKQAK